METLHEISEEFVILKFLNEPRLDNGQSVESIKAHAETKYINEHLVDAKLEQLKNQKYIQPSGDGRYKIDRAGELRYGQMTRIIQIENNINVIRENAEDTNKKVTRITRLGTVFGGIAVILTFVSLIVCGVQTCYTIKAYHVQLAPVATKETECKVQRIQQSCEQKEAAPTIQINVNGNKISCDSLNR